MRAYVSYVAGIAIRKGSNRIKVLTILIVIFSDSRTCEPTEELGGYLVCTIMHKQEK
jgi:hypothetical protein